MARKVSKKSVVKKVEKAVEKMPEKIGKAVGKTVKEVEKELGKEVGKITHYFGNIGVAVIEMTGGLKAGQKIKVKGATTNFEQKVESMQEEHKKIAEAKKGQAIGMKMKEKVRENDAVYIVK